MRDRLNAIIATIHPLQMLENHRSMSGLGSALENYRNEALMRSWTFSQEPVDCLLFALKHLRNGESESELSEALAWLNKAHEAYTKRRNPDFWHELADTIRLDLIIQLNGLRLSHIWKSEHEAAAQLLDEKLEYRAKEDWTKTHKLLVGLLGFHLGIGLEMTQQAVDTYRKLLLRTNDAAAKQLIERRIKGLNEHEYLDPNDFSMNRLEFDGLRHDREKLQRFINKCCLEGEVPGRPEFEAALTKGIHYAAALTVFAPPVALFAVPTAFLGTPIFRLIDRVMYTKDQHDNALYYWILDCAHPWIKENIVKQAKQLCPGYDAVLEHVNSLNQRFREKSRPLDNFYPGQKLKETRDSLMFRKDKLGEETFYSLNAILDVVERDINQFRQYDDKIQQMSAAVHNIAEYMIDYNRQLRANDGRFHARDHEHNQFDRVLIADLPRRLNAAFEVEFNVCYARASTLITDISSRLNSVNAESQDVVRRVRENQENQKTRAAQLEQNARRLF